MPIDWKPLVELVASCESFVLTSHMRPDCDAIGSELGFAFALETLGKRVRIVNGDTPPPHIAFIDPTNRVEVFGQGVSVEDVHAADAHIVLDTSAWGQLGPMAEVIRTSPANKAVIDHHVSGDDLGGLELKDTTAEANGRLVIEAIEALGVSLTAEMAKPLFCAIATDTGWFRFPSVTEKTFAALGKLMEAGASPSAIFQQLFDQNTLARVQLHGHILTRIELSDGGRVACSWATEDDFAKTGSLVSDTEDVVNRLLSIAGVEVALLLADLEPGKVKASLRSRTDFDVSAIAESFGGGGHKKAAGVRIPGTIQDAKQKVLEAVRAKLE